ncbi:MAG: hypothetical protein EB060_04360 [Proteobacteria bacterium]|nr:hypothetical protein [Pseudomonadota bacterium]
MAIINRDELPPEHEAIFRRLNTALQPLFLTGASVRASFISIGRTNDAETVLAPLTPEARARFLEDPEAGQKENAHMRLGRRLENLTHRNTRNVDADMLANALGEAYGNIDPNHPKGQTARTLIEQAFTHFDLPIPAIVTTSPGLTQLSQAVAQLRSTTEPKR